MMRHVTGVLGLLAFVALAASPAIGQEMAGDHEGQAAAQHIAVDPAEIEWKPGPAFMPAEARMAVLEGDPTKEGPFTLRFQFPAGFKIAPHTHPAIEHVTVISGRFGIGLGETWDGEKIRYAGPGGFYVMMPGLTHFAMVTEDTTVQVHAIGPWGLTYVNPADDPRNAQTSND